MHKQPANAFHRWGDKAIVALGRPTLVYDILLSVASRFAPPGKSRRRLARKFNCAASMVPQALLYYTAIYALTGLIALLCLRGLALICAD